MGIFRRRRGAPEGSAEYAEAYLDLRNQALQLTAEHLGRAGESDPVLALLMETRYPEAVATLMGAADGATSLYFSNGGGMIGAGEHPRVADATKRWLELAPDHLESLSVAAAAPDPPGPRLTQFVAVTPDGLRTGIALEDELGAGGHALSPLFYAGHDVIAEVRLLEESRGDR